MPEEQKQTELTSPGKSNQVLSLSEARQKDPSFFSTETESNRWKLRLRHIDGRLEEMPLGTEWEYSSRFGSVRNVVVADSEGKPVFDTPKLESPPSVVIIAWGKDSKSGEIKVGMISEKRVLLDNPDEPQGHEPMLFQQIPMGFLGKVVGEDGIERLETMKEGAVRELTEEIGSSVIKDYAEPEFPHNYPNVNQGTPTGVAFVEVDIEQIGEKKTERGEEIYHTKYIPVKQLLKDIEAGKTDMGYSRLAMSNTAILMFLSGLSAFQNAQRNERLLKDEGEANRQFKKEDPKGYVFHSLRRSKEKNPDRYGTNKERAEAYLSRLYQQTLSDIK